MRLDQIQKDSVWTWQHLPGEKRKVLQILVFSHGEYILYEEIWKDKPYGIKTANLKSWNKSVSNGMYQVQS